MDKTFWFFFYDFLIQIGFKWTEEVFDCEDVALWAMAWAKRFHLATVRKMGGPLSGLAFGEIWIPNKEHAVNVCLHLNDNSEPYVKIYEPQPVIRLKMVCFTEVPMTPKDWKSVSLIKMN